MMIEVFKTNVKDVQVPIVIKVIHLMFERYEANFDLQDCDRILRVKSDETRINSEQIIGLLKALDVNAEILADEIVPAKPRMHSYFL